MTEQSIEFLSEEKFPQLSGIKATAIFFLKKKTNKTIQNKKDWKIQGVSILCQRNIFKTNLQDEISHPEEISFRSKL